MATAYAHWVLGMHDWKEVCLSDCEFGCKVYACGCGQKKVIHNPSYGCKEGK